jgi:hypothetical protein
MQVRNKKRKDQNSKKERSNFHGALPLFNFST